MAYSNVLAIASRNEFREWLSLHHESEQECYVVLKRGKPVDDGLAAVIYSGAWRLPIRWVHHLFPWM